MQEGYNLATDNIPVGDGDRFDAEVVIGRTGRSGTAFPVAPTVPITLAPGHWGLALLAQSRHGERFGVRAAARVELSRALGSKVNQHREVC